MIIVPSNVSAAQSGPVTLRSWSKTIAGLTYSDGDLILATQQAYSNTSVPAGWTLIFTNPSNTKLKAAWTIASGTPTTWSSTGNNYYTCWTNGKSIGAWDATASYTASIYPQKTDGTSGFIFYTEGAAGATVTGYKSDFSVVSPALTLARTSNNDFQPEAYPINMATTGGTYTRPPAGTYNIYANANYQYTYNSNLIEIKNE